MSTPKLNPRGIFFYWIVGLLFIGAVHQQHNNSYKKKYFVEDSSRVYLKGSSNVNTFSCDCEDRFYEQTLEAQCNGGYARFKNARIHIRAKNFNCHNRKIDADMQKALMADQYPEIKVSLEDTWQNAKCLKGECTDWFDVQANVNITIAATTRKEAVSAKAKVLSPGKILLKGEKALQLSAFGIKPPEAMLGMIKVNDYITFYFDLVVKIEDSK